MTTAPTPPRNALSDLLETRDWLLADGATGTNLFAMGLEAGEPPELWNIDAPEKIRALHQGFVDAGSDILLTNSFGGNAYRLKLHNAQSRVAELNRAAAAIAREIADAAGRPVIVAGSLGPTGEILEPAGPLSIADAADAFEEQGAALLAGGADVLWFETLSAAEEAHAAAIAAARLNAPLCGTLSFDTAGRTMMGLSPAGYAELTGELAAVPLAFGANCGVGAPDMLRTVLSLTEADSESVIIAKGNAGIPKYVDGHIHYDGSPELMGQYAVLARGAGARIIGGCCGSTYDHIRAMRAALEATPDPVRPDLETVVEILGAFNTSEAVEGAAPPRRRRRKA